MTQKGSGWWHRYDSNDWMILIPWLPPHPNAGSASTDCVKLLMSLQVCHTGGILLQAVASFSRTHPLNVWSNDGPLVNTYHIVSPYGLTMFLFLVCFMNLSRLCVNENGFAAVSRFLLLLATATSRWQRARAGGLATRGVGYFDCPLSQDLAPLFCLPFL